MSGHVEEVDDNEVPSVNTSYTVSEPDQPHSGHTRPHRDTYQQQYQQQQYAHPHYTHQHQHQHQHQHPHQGFNDPFFNDPFFGRTRNMHNNNLLFGNSMFGNSMFGNSAFGNSMFGGSLFGSGFGGFDDDFETSFNSDPMRGSSSSYYSSSSISYSGNGSKPVVIEKTSSRINNNGIVQETKTEKDSRKKLEKISLKRNIDGKEKVIEKKRMNGGNIETHEHSYGIGEEDDFEELWSREAHVMIGNDRNNRESLMIEENKKKDSKKPKKTPKDPKKRRPEFQ